MIEKNEQETKKKYISLRQLSKEIFPYNNEAHAYTKTLKNFKTYCESIGIDPYNFKSSRDYQIPLNTKANWILILRHVSLMSNHPKEHDVLEFTEELVKIQKNMNDTLFANESKLPNETANSLADQLTAVSEMYYNFEGISHMLELEAHSRIEKDFQYIRDIAPHDRIVLYSELYNSYLGDARKSIREIIDRKLYEDKKTEE